MSKQGVLGGVHGEFATIINARRFRIGSVVNLRGDVARRPLTVVGSVNRDDGEECAVVTWFDKEEHTVQTAIPVGALVEPN